MKKEEKINIILEILGCESNDVIKTCKKWLSKNVNECKLIMSKEDYKQLQYELEDEDENIKKLYKNINIGTKQEIQEIINKIGNDSLSFDFDEGYSTYIISENGIINYGDLNLYIIK